LGITVSDFHQSWPWSPKRWDFVEQRMANIATLRWHGEASAFESALEQARSVRCTAEPHLAFWLNQWAECTTPVALFAPVDHLCTSFSQWWKQVSPHRPTAQA
jgi:deoxyribodipyrimidine photo-lyase